jgi:hypothetical protein
MISPTKTILPIALVAALLGGSVGAFVMRAPKTTDTANQTLTAATPASTTDASQTQPVSNEQATASLNGDQAAYRDGFQEGFLAAQDKSATNDAIYSTAQDRSSNAVPVQYRSGSRSRRVSNGSRQVYYDYNQRQPQKRSFWQKHRDKLTVAAGTGGGALLGGLIGGKKGSLIGALAGAGGSALYTYKIRKKGRN